MAEIYVAIGSNVEPQRYLRSALVALAENFGVLRLSPVYRNRPIGFDGDDFLNMVAAFESDQSVAEVVSILEAIEAENGRERGGEKFGPRTLDLDLLLYGDAVAPDGPHQVPRDEITRYAFVLKPLRDLAGERIHPVAGRSFDEIWEDFDQDNHPMEMVDLPLVS